MAASEKCAVLYVNSGSGKPSSRPGNRWIKCLIGLVVITALSSAAICLFVCLYTLQVVSEVQSRLEWVESTLAQEQESRTSLVAQAVTAKLGEPTPGRVEARSQRSKRNSRRQNRNRDRNRRQNRNRNRGRDLRERRRLRSHHRAGHVFSTVYIHLVGTNNNNHEASFQDGNFQWNRFDDSDISAGLTLEPQGGGPYTSIKIRNTSAGVYDVYSQVALEGRSYSNNHVSCGHKTELVRSGQVTVLMESKITQHNRGDYISRMNHVYRYPFDTVNHRGTFLLQADDRIRVRRTPNCDHFRYRSSPSYAFFGVVKIANFPVGRD